MFEIVPVGGVDFVICVFVFFFFTIYLYYLFKPTHTAKAH